MVVVELNLNLIFFKNKSLLKEQNLMRLTLKDGLDPTKSLKFLKELTLKIYIYWGLIPNSVFLKV